MCILGGAANRCSPYENSMKISQKTKNRYIIRPSDSTSGYLPKENEKTNSEYICTPMFIAVLLTIAKICE